MAPKSHPHHRRATKPRRHAKATAKLVNPGRNALGNVSRPPLMARERAQIRRVRVSKWKVARNLRAERLSESEEGDEDKENMEVEEVEEVGEVEESEESEDSEDDEDDEESEENDEDDEDGEKDVGDEQTKPRAEETTTTQTTFEEGRRVNVNDLPWINGFPGNYTFTEVFENGDFVG
ncbi:hypothetical protein EG328_003315 [Venturia inaequalis]|nr:hypothetical protein EG328_003315 [Venturia inaequalis]